MVITPAAKQLWKKSQHKNLPVPLTAVCQLLSLRYSHLCWLISVRFVTVFVLTPHFSSLPSLASSLPVSWPWLGVKNYCGCPHSVMPGTVHCPVRCRCQSWARLSFTRAQTEVESGHFPKHEEISSPFPQEEGKERPCSCRMLDAAWQRSSPVPWAQKQW